jgi:hypothetical protein
MAHLSLTILRVSFLLPVRQLALPFRVRMFGKWLVICTSRQRHDTALGQSYSGRIELPNAQNVKDRIGRNASPKTWTTSGLHAHRRRL